MRKRTAKAGTLQLYKPYVSTRKDKKLMVFVRNPKTGRIKTIHFGQKGYKHNYSKKAREMYLARSSGIKNKSGKLTKNNKLGANYWARRILWGAKR